jgi:hypothetical protein
MSALPSPVTPEQKLEILAEAVLSDRSNKGWQRARSLDEIPAAVGHYALYDGIHVRGFGVAWNMRHAVQQCYWFDRCTFRVMLFLPDSDGSAALWLDGKITCKRCNGRIHEIGLHDEESKEDFA